MPVILHIGMQKTGTSALQYFLHFNHDHLARDGLIYPHTLEFQEDLGASGVSYHNSIAGALGRIRSSFPIMSRDGMQSLRQFLLNSKERIVLSAEDFSRSLDLSDISDFFRGITTTVIVYLRDQVSWAQSMYNQRNKLLFTHASERLLSEDILTPEDLFKFLKVERYAALLRYDELLRRWSDVFGSENIIVRLFPPRTNLSDDFMTAIGVDNIQDYELPPRTNENLSNEWLSFVREIGTDAGTQQALLTVQKLSAYANAGKINLSGQTAFLPARIVNKMQIDYAESNQRVAREFFGREQLFP